MNDNIPHQHAGSFTIRRVAQGDREPWQKLYRQYAEFYRVEVNDAVLEQTWSWLMAPEHPEEGIVVELANGVLAGMAHYRAFPKPLLGQDAGFLDDLFVLPAHRGEGIGRGLVAAVAAIARERGWPLVRWITAHDNTPARHLYDGMAEATTWVTYDLNPAMHEQPERGKR
ncbi:Histone acetyltransferase HPA2 and related acetyltransferases [plant metagenome]|uniref:Histone acetyltransferase HPA2 and related acetyltransferases n=1 Tax=plant metagenome TaxID=1297885 RepID=A0A484UL92_9ZZZZ